MLNKHVVIRTQSAGVHIGTLVFHKGTEVILHNSRRLWKWGGAFTLSAVAHEGINPNESRMSISLPEILLTQAIEIIPTTEAARRTFDKTKDK